MWEQIKDLKFKVEDYRTTLSSEAREYAEQMKSEVVGMMYEHEQIVESAKEELILA